MMTDTKPAKTKRKPIETYRVGKVIVEKRELGPIRENYNRPKEILDSTLKTS